MYWGVGVPGRIRLTCCKTQATWALERHIPRQTDKDPHTPQAHRPAHQPGSPLFPALRRPTAPTSQLPTDTRLGSPRPCPLRKAPIPASLVPGVCVTLYLCAPILFPGYLGRWPSPQRPPAGSSSSSVIPALSSGSAPAGAPHLNVQGSPTQMPQASCSLHLSLTLLSTSPLWPWVHGFLTPQSQLQVLTSRREQESPFLPRSEGLPSSLSQGRGTAAHYPAVSPRPWPRSPGRESLSPGPLGLRHQL